MDFVGLGKRKVHGDYDDCHLVAGLGEHGLPRRAVAPRQLPMEPREVRGDAPGHILTHPGQHAAAAGDAVEPADVPAMKHQVAARRGAGHLDARGDGFAAGLQVAHPLSARDGMNQQLGHFAFEPRGMAEDDALFELQTDGLIDGRKAVPECDGSQGILEIDIRVSIEIPYATAYPSLTFPVGVRLRESLENVRVAAPGRRLLTTRSMMPLQDVTASSTIMPVRADS